MTPAQRAMTTWIGALARGGVVELDAAAEAGEAVAAYVVGEARLGELRAFFAQASPAVAERERAAALEVCVRMAHADREIQPQERELLRALIERSEVADEARHALRVALRAHAPLGDIERRLTQPALRELMLALAWELALADGRLDGAEAAFFEELADRFAISGPRRAELRAAVSEQLG